MKIKTSSWHYRLHSRLDWEIPTSLCGYFWKTVWMFVIALVLGPIVLAITPFALGFIWVVERLDNLNDEIRRNEKMQLDVYDYVPPTLKVKRSIATYSIYWIAAPALFIFAGVFTLVFGMPSGGMSAWGTVGASALVATLATGLFWFLPLSLWADAGDGFYRWNRFKNEYEQPIQDDLVGSYFKAVKNRVCPLLEFTDE